MRHNRIFLAPVLVAGMLGLIALPTAAAKADTTAALPISSFHQIVADTADGYLFFSEGPWSDSLLNTANDSSPLVVTNLSGTEVATIDPDGVEGLALDSSTGTLYAALAGQDAVAAISIKSIASVISGAATAPTQTLYPLASGDVPYSVALQSGKVWVSYNPGTGIGAGSSAIGDIDLATASPSSAFEPATAGPSNWYSAPDLAADPNDSGVLVAVEPDDSGTPAATFSTTTDPATPLATPESLGTTGAGSQCGSEQQVAVVAGGKQFVAACGANGSSDVNVYDTTDVTTAVSSYTTPGGDGASVAIAPDGTVAVGADGTALSHYTGIIDYVYSADGGTALRNVADFMPGDGSEYAGGGLAWAADGSELFSVDYAEIGSGWQYVLQTVSDPETTRSTLSLTTPATVDVGRTVAVTGTLKLSTGAYPPAGTPVTITRSMTGTTPETKTVTTGTDGAFSLTDAAPPTYGTYTYTASYAGNSTTAASTTTRAMTITRFETALTLTANATDYAYGAKVTVTAHLGTTYTGRYVTIYAEPFGTTSKKTLVSAKVNSAGNVTATYTPTTSTTFSTYFGGDAEYAPKTVTRDAYVDAHVSLIPTGYYTTVDHGGTPYHVYHHTTQLTAPVAVTPNKSGECVELEVQEIYGGTWHANLTTGCGTLNSSSKATGYLNLTDATGGLFRVRADYTRSSTDTKNLNADSGWFYFSVVK
jgi:hypothetical protein